MTRLLWLSIALTVATHLRWGLAPLAWICLIPALLYTLQTRPDQPNARSFPRVAGALLGTSLIAWTLTVAKICTEPLPLAMAPMFGLPIGLMQALPLIAWAALRRRAHGPLVTLSLPALVVIGEWTQAHATPLGTWGALAHTQHADLALLQLSSLAGAAMPGFLIATASVVIAELIHARAWASPAHTHRSTWAVGVGLIAALLIAKSWGGARLQLADATDETTATVATIGTDAAFGGLPLPSDDALATIDAGLFERTRAAAAGGAQVIVWTEGATLKLPDQAAPFAARISALAAETQTTIAASWIEPVSIAPLQYENKAQLFSPNGDISAPYLKHQPVPGEPAIPGVGPAPRAQTAAGVVAPAICYDFDFPGLVRDLEDVDLVALPSSDWRGIDPDHTRMTTVRAIESGVNIVRSTRFGESAAIDAYGRVRGTLSHFDSDERVMSAQLPIVGVSTLYGAVGDWFIALSAAFVVGAFGASAQRRRVRAQRQVMAK